MRCSLDSVCELGITHSFLLDDLVRLLRITIGDRYRVEYEPLPDQTIPASHPLDNNGESGHLPLPNGSGSSPHLSRSEKEILAWVGEESTTLTKLLMTSSGTDV